MDANTDPNVDKVLVPVWTQMAEHYKGRSAYLYYEILNEPHGITDARWGQIQQKVITAIRAVDRVHTDRRHRGRLGQLQQPQVLCPRTGTTT